MPRRITLRGNGLILFKTIHANYVKTWKEYQKTGSYRKGARWNSAGTPVMYLSSNPQNAVLELANYATTPKEANKLHRLVVFDFPALKLNAVRPEELPGSWNVPGHEKTTQLAGDNWLGMQEYNGFIVPSVAINEDISTHPINEIREAAWANVIVDIASIDLDKVTLIEEYSPVFSGRMFAS